MHSPCIEQLVQCVRRSVYNNQLQTKADGRNNQIHEMYRERMKNRGLLRTYQRVCNVHVNGDNQNYQLAKCQTLLFLKQRNLRNLQSTKLNKQFPARVYLVVNFEPGFIRVICRRTYAINVLDPRHCEFNSNVFCCSWLE